jgi:hypothetical protein
VALNPKTRILSRDAALNAAFDVLNSGFFKGYDGVQPVDADTALGVQVLLFSNALSVVAFAVAAAASKSANAVANGTGLALAVCTWATLVLSDNVTRVMDMSAGTGGTNLVMNSANISVGATIVITSITLTQAP